MTARPVPSAPPWNAKPRACREYAIKTLLASNDRRDQIRDMLRDDRPREVVGHFCIYVLQGDALALKPWVSPPISWREPKHGPDCPGEPEMRALVTRMRALKVSVFHPDPLAAVEAAEAAQAGEQHEPTR